MHVQLADAGPILLFVLFGVVFVAIIIVAVIMAKKRREAWQKLAAAMGCAYSRYDSFDIDRAYPHSLFNQGHARRASNVVSGRLKGYDLRAFDYQYKTTSGTGKNRSEQTHSFTCLILQSPISFQNLWIRPESFLDRVGEFFGVDDIDFESEEFSRRFHVKCRDKKFAYDVLHARAMELLLECGKIYIEAQGHDLLFYYNGSKRVPDDVEPMIRRALKWLELLPNYLIEQYGGRV